MEDLFKTGVLGKDFEIIALEDQILCSILNIVATPAGPDDAW